MITLPFPASILSGHAKGHWRAKATATKTHREWARLATLAALPRVPDQGDIHIHVLFVPPNRRIDRGNMPGMAKAYFDGIADALGVNDRRFLPSFSYAEPETPGRVEFEVFAHTDGDEIARSVEAYSPEGIA